MYAVDMLGELGLPEDLIADVRSMLSERAGELEQAKPGSIGSVFGGSDQGAQLSHHAALARQKVAEAVVQMAEGLRGMSGSLAAHAERVTDTDAQSAVDLKRLEGYTSCVSTPTFHSNASCTVPTTDGGS